MRTVRGSLGREDAAARPPTSASDVRGHLPALDGLRGAAIVLVMLQHFRMRPDVIGMRPGGPVDEAVTRVLNAGWVGVDLFFVLSGFLITGILLDAKDSPGYFRAFYARRVLRIFPLYYGFLAFRFFLLPALYSPDWIALRTPASEQVWTWAYLTNVQIAIAQSWEHTPELTAHFWSLAVEEQFYLLWPWVVARCSRRTLLGVCVVAAAASLTVRLGLIGLADNTHGAYMLTPARLEPLALGALVALVARGPLGLAPLAPWALPAGAGAAAGVLALSLWRGELTWADHVVEIVGFPLIALLFASLLVRVLAAPDRRAAHFIDRPVLRFFGRYSYGLYVIHVALLPFLQRGFGVESLPAIGGSRIPGQIAFILVGGTASVALALLSWNLWEKHFLKLKDHFRYGGPRRAMLEADRGEGGIEGTPHVLANGR